MTVKAIGLSDSAPWRLRGEELSRPDGRFFKITQRAGGVWIDQPEIGLLGFAIRPDSSNHLEILCHAKAEPGNLPLVQLAPTVQATRSNYERAHGGKSTAFLDLFSTEKVVSVRSVSRSLQSEQGTKFWHKRNLNQIVFAKKVDVQEGFYWAPLDELLALLGQGGTVNTDARSVLASTPWSSLRPAKSVIFRNAPLSVSSEINFGGFTPDPSFELASDVLTAQRRELEKLPQITVDGGHEEPLKVGSFQDEEKKVGFFEIHSSTREVPIWRQPLIEQSTPERHVLFALVGRKRLSFLLHARSEPGLRTKVEFSATLSFPRRKTLTEPISDEILTLLDVALQQSVVLTSINQTDEGGRFFQVVATYEVVLVERSAAWPDSKSFAHSGLVEVSPWALNALCEQELATTNELRTLTSLVMSWL